MLSRFKIGIGPKVETGVVQMEDGREAIFMFSLHELSVFEVTGTGGVVIITEQTLAREEYQNLMGV